MALVGMLGLQSCDDEREISYGKLPSLARAFIETYFPDQSVSYAERDKDDGRREYSVVLSNGTEIDFDQNSPLAKAGSWSTPRTGPLFGNNSIERHLYFWHNGGRCNGAPVRIVGRVPRK